MRPLVLGTQGRTTDKREEDKVDLKDQQESFEHEQDSEEIDQSNGNRGKRGKGVLQVEVTSGQSEGCL